MAKPIFLVALPFESAQHLAGLQSHLEKQLTDYYVIIYLHNKEEAEFRAVYEKDIDEVKFEELKQIVRNQISDLQILKKSYG